MKLVYVCAPFRGRDMMVVISNVNNAVRLGANLVRLGEGEVFPVVPHAATWPVWRELDFGGSDEYWLESTSKLLEMCDAVVVYGCVPSEGMIREIARAGDLGIPIIMLPMADELLREALRGIRKRRGGGRR